jgi:hypothetical protein
MADSYATASAIKIPIMQIETTLKMRDMPRQSPWSNDVGLSAIILGIIEG